MVNYEWLIMEWLMKKLVGFCFGVLLMLYSCFINEKIPQLEVVGSPG